MTDELEPIGVYGRVSTKNQLDNDRYNSTFVDMTDIVARYGFRPVMYDEGHRSGATLINRKVASAMLADVKSGKLRGISAPDIGRLSRDEWLTDGKVIAETLIDAHAILVTRDDGVFDLRKEWDLERFQDRLREAGKERRRIARRFWEGHYSRARAVLEDGAQPFSRHRTMWGYRLAFLLDANGLPVVSRRGIPRRFTEKDPARAADMLVLQRELEHQPNLGELYAALRTHGIKGPNKHLGDDWNARAVEAMLLHPNYRGRWAFLRTIRARLFYSLDPRRDDFDLDSAVTDAPELRYWSDAQADRWHAKFFGADRIDRRVRRDKTGFDHPLIGVVRCPDCHSVLVGKGKHGYICPQYNAGKCRVTTIADSKIDACLLELLPLMQEHLDALRDQSQERLRERQDGALDIQMEALDQRERAVLQQLKALTDRNLPAPQSFTDELVDVGRQRQRLLDEQAAQERVSDAKLEAERALAMLGDNALDVVREVAYPVRAQIYRAFIEWAEVRSMGPGRAPARLVDYKFHTGETASGLLAKVDWWAQVQAA